MRRQYVKLRRGSLEFKELDGENYLSRVVIEDREMIDIGILDENGDPIMATQRMDPIGFIRFDES